MKKVKGNGVVWGVIGAGDVCEKKSMPAMYKIPNSSVKAIMRRNADKAEDFAKRHNIPFWYTNADQLLSDPEINAIYIATPPNSHAYYTIKAAQAGKAVYVEKPMAISLQECNTMIEACENAGVPLFVAYYRRTLPKFLKLKKILANKEIGDVRLIQIEMLKPLVPDIIAKLVNNWRVQPDISGGGYFHDVACHQLDLIDFLFGPLKNVTGLSANQGKIYQADDIVTANFSVGNNILCTGAWCFTTGKINQKEIITITGSRGKIEFSTFGNSPIIVDSESTGRNEYNFEAPEHIEEPMIRLIVNDLLGRDECPCTGAVGARTSLVMEKICNGFK